MGYTAVVIIALVLAMDALAVSVTNGVVISDFKRRHAVKIGAYFGAFQFLMPLIGFFLGSGFEKLVSQYDHWIAFFLLAAIGINMIVESIKEDDAQTVGKSAAEVLCPKNLIMQAIATSIDALAIGISFAVIKSEGVLVHSLIIGVTAFVLSYLGANFGKKLGGLFQKNAEIIGGLILIGIGVKILIEHIFL